MKTIITVIGIVIVMTLLVVNRDAIFNGVEYVYEKEEVVKEVEVTPDWATDEEAVQAAKDVIRKKELEAELSQLDEQLKEIQSKRKEVVNELNSY